jgi:transposase InsO family protein
LEIELGGNDALLHHSDRGSQYASEQFQRLMAYHGVVCSMSRSGNVWDNAAMESFFSSLKTERTASIRSAFFAQLAGLDGQGVADRGAKWSDRLCPSGMAYGPTGEELWSEDFHGKFQ